MPYSLRGTCVVDASGQTVPGGCHPSRAAARRHLRALYANVPDATMKAGNYGARAGQVISGNLARGGDGKFTSAGKPSAAKPAAQGVQLSKPTPKKLPKAPKRARGGRRPKIAKPKKTDEQKRQERDDAKLRERQANRDAVKQRMAANDAGLGPAGFDALMAFSTGQPPSGAMADGLITMGLAERANDGSVRMSAAGRATVNAANRGDYQAALDAISKGTDQETGRRTRAEQRAARAAERERRRAAREAKRRGGAQDIGGAMQGLVATKAQTAEERAMFAKMGGGGSGGSGRKLWSRGEGGKRQPTRSQAESHYEHREAQIKRRVATTKRRKDEVYDAYKRAIRSGKNPPRAALDKARAAYDKAVKDEYNHLHAGLHGYNIQGQKEAPSFAIFKDARGKLRWIARSTTAFRDRDGEIISTAALIKDADRMMRTGQFGPLRYWHAGIPDPDHPTAPWGPGVDLGMCDFSTVIGRTAVESGTFYDEAVGKAFAEAADEYELSPGFFHPYGPLGPPDGVYEDIRRFERSPVPRAHARASNYFTGLMVKEQRMKPDEFARRVAAFKADMSARGVDATTIDQALAGVVQVEKAADAQRAVYKSDDAPTIYLLPDGVTPGIIQDGRFVALKAAAPPTLPEPAAKDDGEGDMEAMAEDVVDGEMGGGEYIGDMTPAEFWAQLQQYLAPVLKMQDLVKTVTDMSGELKSMFGGVATKEAGRDAEIAALKEATQSLKSQLDTAIATLKELEGDQPIVINNLAIKEALTSTGPQAPLDPNAPQVPDDPARPMAPIAARLMPELYSSEGWGPNGWPVAGGS